MQIREMIEARKKKYLELYKKDGNRKGLLIVEPTWDVPHCPTPYKNAEEALVTFAYEKYSRAAERMSWLDDDSLPFIDIHTGTEIFAAAMGAKVYENNDEMPFALPFMHDPSEVAALKVPKLEDSSLMRLFERASKLKSMCGKDALLRLPDIQSPMDIACLLFDKTDLFCALLTDPDAIKELCDKTAELLTAFLDTWFAEFGKEFMAHYPDYYMDYGITLSEDEIGAVSPEMFSEFFLPHLNMLSQRYGKIGIHCCANSKHQWNGFLQIENLTLLNLGQPLEIQKESFKVFSNHCALMPMWDGRDNAGSFKKWRGELPSDCRMIYYSEAQTKDEALRICDAFKEAF